VSADPAAGYRTREETARGEALGFTASLEKLTGAANALAFDLDHRAEIGRWVIPAGMSGNDVTAIENAAKLLRDDLLTLAEGQPVTRRGMRMIDAALMVRFVAGEQVQRGQRDPTCFLAHLADALEAGGGEEGRQIMRDWLRLDAAQKAGAA
jgi:hypothetical protein